MTEINLFMWKKPLVSVSDASRTNWVVFSEGMCTSPFHLILPRTLKFPVVDFMRELTMVTSKGSCTSYWKVIVWLGRSWIPAPLLKNIVPDAVTDRLEILTGCWAFILSTKMWRLQPSPFWCMTLTILHSWLAVWTLTSKYRFELDWLCFTGVTCWMYPITTVDEERDESIEK